MALILTLVATPVAYNIVADWSSSRLARWVVRARGGGSAGAGPAAVRADESDAA